MNNTIYITDENGVEHKMIVLFTFNANEKDYCVVHKEHDEDEVFAFVYDQEGNLFPVENEEELAMVQEVIFSFDGADDEEE